MDKQRWRVVAAALAGLIVIGGCRLGGTDEDTARAAPEFVVDSSAPVEPVAEPVTEEPTEEPTPVPVRTTSRPPTKKPAPQPSPTEEPNNFEPPPCADYDGKAVSRKKVKAALNAAAAKHYWPKTAPTLLVPADLVRSVAWQESGWQSNIVNCDGGYGLMQLMPDTVDWLNTRFEQSYDKKDYRQNATLGANYLAWLTVYLGEKYFGKDYSLSTSKCKSTSSWCLLNTVISAYHSGAGVIEDAAASKELPDGDGYVYKVRSLMKSCYCDRY